MWPVSAHPSAEVDGEQFSVLVFVDPCKHLRRGRGALARVQKPLNVMCNEQTAAYAHRGM